MAFTFQCQPSDFREALAAHAVWATLDAKADRASSWIGRVSLWAFMAVLFVMTYIKAEPDDYTWRVTPLSLLVGGFSVPVIMLMLSVQLLLRSRPSARTATGNIHTPIPRPRDSQAKALRGVLGWLVFLVLGAATFYMTRLSAISRVARGIPSPPAPVGRQIPWIGVVAIIFVPLLVAVAILNIIQRRYRLIQFERGSPNLFFPQTLQIDNEGFTLLHELGHTRLKWPGVRRFLESENLLLVYPSDNSFHIFPKHDLHAAGQLDAILSLLHQHVPTGVRPPRTPTGFAVQGPGPLPPPLPAIPVTEPSHDESRP